jgi:hypothetical protein
MSGDRDPESDRLSRRDFVGIGGAAALGTAASLGGLGCSLLPPGGRGPTSHPCDHPHCRYHREVEGQGRCSLLSRVAGGEP